MEEKFRLAITPNYSKVIWKIIALLICAILPIILFGVLLEKEVISPSTIRFEIVFPLYIISVGLTIYFIIRKTYFIDTVTITNTSLQIPKLRNITFREIKRYKSYTIRGFTSYIISTKEGKKIAFGPTNNFSISADKTFRQFIIVFETKIVNN